MPRGEPTRSLPVRFTEAERERLEAAAAAAPAESVTAFVRRVALEACGPGSARPRVGAGGPSPAISGEGGPVPRRPVHAPTCRCAVCRPAKGEGRKGKGAAGG